MFGTTLLRTELALIFKIYLVHSWHYYYYWSYISSSVLPAWSCIKHYFLLLDLDYRTIRHPTLLSLMGESQWHNLVIIKIFIFIYKMELTYTILKY